MINNQNDGLCFVFKIDDITVKAKGSLLSGKEFIYINEELVSEQKSLNKVSKHKFEKDGKEYEVIFYMPSVMRGKLECMLFQDGQLIEKKIKQVQSKHKSIRAAIFLLICSVSFFVTMKYNLPMWLMVSFIALVFVGGTIYTLVSVEYEDVPVTYAK